MFEAHQFQRVALHGAQHGVVGDVRAFQHAFHQIFRRDQRLTVNLNQCIFELTGEEIARLAGSVHGVVVQITSEIGPLTPGRPNTFDRILIDRFEGHVD